MAQLKSKAFFGYSREDSAFVLSLAKDLRAAGAAVWLDQLDMRPGDRWDQGLRRHAAGQASLPAGPSLSPISQDGRAFRVSSS
jgi:TIR domain